MLILRFQYKFIFTIMNFTSRIISTKRIFTHTHDMYRYQQRIYIISKNELFVSTSAEYTNNTIIGTHNIYPVRYLTSSS